VASLAPETPPWAPVASLACIDSLLASRRYDFLTNRGNEIRIPTAVMGARSPGPARPAHLDSENGVTVSASRRRQLKVEHFVPDGPDQGADSDVAEPRAVVADGAPATVTPPGRGGTVRVGSLGPGNVRWLQCAGAIGPYAS
jgi:hypothetical protein